MNDYNDEPYYYWYTSKTPPEGNYRSHFYMGQWYGAYIEEAEPKTIDQYNLTFVGTGDITFPETHGRKVAERVR